jgi:hypothetical protein
MCRFGANAVVKMPCNAVIPIGVGIIKSAHSVKDALLLYL